MINLHKELKQLRYAIEDFKQAVRNDRNYFILIYCCVAAPFAAWVILEITAALVMP